MPVRQALCRTGRGRAWHRPGPERGRAGRRGRAVG